MEIMKVFSDLYDDERLYSVLLSEEEMYLFSELQKEFASVRKTKKALDLIARKWNPQITAAQAVKNQNKGITVLNNAVKNTTKNLTKGQNKAFRDLSRSFERADSVSNLNREALNAIQNNKRNIESRYGKQLSSKLAHL